MTVRYGFLLLLGMGIALQLVFSTRLQADEILYPSNVQIQKDGPAILLEDYATLPFTGRGGSITDFGPHPVFNNQLARPNFLRFEPGAASQSASRVFVCDLNRDLYLLDVGTRTFTSYINFQAVFPNFYNASGYSGGLIAFEFDPAYATNGIFFTVHWETGSSGATPINSNLPGLDLSGGYVLTTAMDPPTGSVLRQNVIVEWTDTNTANATFEGTARELLRVGMNSQIHPVGDLIFNPRSAPGDADYRNLYVAVGDGRSGEQSSTRTTPQRLDAIQGKILRITPDLGLRPADELGLNGRYRIPTTGPDPNPFTSGTVTNLADLKKEIFAYGFRNCHRLSWDPVADVLLANDIGLHAWEEVNIVHKGANYGYSGREGPEQLFVGGPDNGKTGSQIDPPVSFPDPDTLTVDGLDAPVAPVYPVAVYSHRDGDGIASGFVYRGALMPHLRGRYIFGDIPNGRLFHCDLEEMIAVDDGDRNTVATIHELRVVFNSAARRLFDVVADEFDARGGTASGALPGSAGTTAGSDADGVPYGGGRADIRLAEDGDGELYVISKSDGMIRQLSAMLIPPTITSATIINDTVTLGWPAVSNQAYRIQYKATLAETNWTDLAGDVTATGATASKTDPATAAGTRLYRLLVLP